MHGIYDLVRDRRLECFKLSFLRFSRTNRDWSVRLQALRAELPGVLNRCLEDGMKVKVRIRFRGREITYPEIARKQLVGIAEELSDVAAVEQSPNLEGRTMLMILAPDTKKMGGKE